MSKDGEGSGSENKNGLRMAVLKRHDIHYTEGKRASTVGEPLHQVGISCHHPLMNQKLISFLLYRFCSSPCLTAYSQ